jgi:hypothetical protein
MKVTVAQSMKAVELCHYLSNSLKPIYVFRFNPLLGYIFILAGDDLQIVIQPDGNWEFIDDDTRL